MLIKSFEINNFRRNPSVKIDGIDNLLVLVGKNDIGKSSILEALDNFFDDKKHTVSKLDFNTNNPISTKIVFDNGCIAEKSYEINSKGKVSRTLDSNYKSNRTIFPDYRLFGADGDYLKAPLGKLSINELKKKRDHNLRVAIELNYQYRSINKQKSILYGLGDVQTEHKLKSLIQELQQIYDNSLFISDLNDCVSQKRLKDILAIFDYHFMSVSLPDGLYERISEIYDSIIKLLDTELLERILVDSNIEYTTSEQLTANESSIDRCIEQYVNEQKSRDIIEKWDSVLNIFDDNSIPINKRGAGVRRVVALHQFAMNNITKIIGNRTRSVIYAIEEPEISLHPNQQRDLMFALKTLMGMAGVQIMITTHSPIIVKELADNVNDIIVLTKDALPARLEVGPVVNRMRHKCIVKPIPYTSLNEINYIAFDEPSVEYHIELFGYIQSKLREKYNSDLSFQHNWDTIQYTEINIRKLTMATWGAKDRPSDVDSVAAVDVWLNMDFSDAIRLGVPKDMDWTDTRPADKVNLVQPEKRTLPYCVRNQIDHPTDINRRYDDKELIKKSIDIMRNAIMDNWDSVFV